jgi:hypothetical protein
MVRPTVMLLVLSEPLGINDVGQPVEDSKLFSEPWTWAPDALGFAVLRFRYRHSGG